MQLVPQLNIHRIQKNFNIMMIDLIYFQGDVS